MVVPAIAYPDYIVDLGDPRMDEDYEKIQAVPGEYFKNKINASVTTFRDSMLLLDEVVERSGLVKSRIL